VTLPLVVPALANAFLLLFGCSLADFATPLILAGSDFPVLPTASDAVKADYKAGYAAEQHSCSTADVELTEPVSATG